MTCAEDRPPARDTTMTTRSPCRACNGPGSSWSRALAAGRTLDLDRSIQIDSCQSASAERRARLNFSTIIEQKRINYGAIFPLESGRTAYNPCTGYPTYHGQITRSGAKLEYILASKGMILVHGYHPNTCRPHSYPCNA